MKIGGAADTYRVGLADTVLSNGGGLGFDGIDLNNFRHKDVDEAKVVNQTAGWMDARLGSKSER